MHDERCQISHLFGPQKERGSHTLYGCELLPTKVLIDDHGECSFKWEDKEKLMLPEGEIKSCRPELLEEFEERKRFFGENTGEGDEKPRMRRYMKALSQNAEKCDSVERRFLYQAVETSPDALISSLRGLQETIKEAYRLAIQH